MFDGHIEAANCAIANTILMLITSRDILQWTQKTNTQAESEA